MEGFEIRRVPIARKFMQYFYTPSLLNEFDDFRPQLVHAHGYRSYQTEIAYNYCKKNKIPFVLSLHGEACGYKYMSSGFGGSLPYSLYDKIRGMKQLRNSAALVVNSTREESEVKDLLRDAPNRIEKIPVGSEIHSKRKAKSDGTLLLVERITLDRDPRPLIAAIGNVKAAFPNVQLRIVGKEVVNSSVVRQGVVAKSKELVKSHGLESNVTFTGELRGSELESEYANADIFVYNSRYENFGQPLLEAASYGLPIISTDVGVVSDLIQDGYNGLIVKRADDANAFDQKIRSLLENVEMIEEFGQRVRQKVKESFGWDSIIAKYLSLYTELLGAVPRTPPV
jgi:glycosyltransferase involved in cell wall biosynthesis